MTGTEDDAQEWHELDQASTRKSIRDMIRRDMPENYHEKVPALRQFLAIVKEEIANALVTNVNLVMGDHPESSAADARRLADRLERDLSSLGLAFQHPTTGAPCRLGVAASPPSNENQNWLQLEPLYDAKAIRPTRLPRPLERLKIAPEPPRIRSVGPAPSRMK